MKPFEKAILLEVLLLVMKNLTRMKKTGHQSGVHKYETYIQAEQIIYSFTALSTNIPC
ncbi:MAG: hypothetical protein ABFS56_20160 [Pseudomonadota bacterium]